MCGVISYSFYFDKKNYPILDPWGKGGWGSGGVKWPLNNCTFCSITTKLANVSIYFLY